MLQKSIKVFYNMVKINWNKQGHISPIDLNNPTDTNRSPYKMDLLEFYNTFSYSDNRKIILNHFILYRKYLHKLHIKKGFQWINGSFLELIEKKENRSPNDIDVVTFFEIDKRVTDILNNKEMINDLISPRSKEIYLTDGYLIDISKIEKKKLIELSIYWYGVWSHTRENYWKGFIEIDLDSSEDDKLQEYLKRR